MTCCGSWHEPAQPARFHCDMTNLSELKSLLLQALAEKSVRRGSFTLASGAKSDLYVDAKLTTLDPRCALLVGKIGWELIKQTAAEKNLRVDAVGGLTMGADPIALSIGIAAQLDDPARAPRIFNVRKEPKRHGLSKNIEGNFSAGDSVVVIDDVITTGGSTIQAIDKIQADGGKVAFAIVLVDRQEQSGCENIEARGCPVVSIFNRKDVLAADARKQPHPAAA
jgi:orotate phosphoribosyltransferase